MKKVSQYLLIDSRDRVSGTADEFVVKFNRTINANRVELVGCNIPCNFYQIDMGRQKLYFTEAGQIGGGPPLLTEVILTPGTYSIAQLCIEIAAQMTAVSQNGYTYTVAYNSVTDSFTFSRGASVYNWQLNWGVGAAAGDYLYQRLGFAAVDTAYAATHTSTTGPALGPPAYVAIDIAQVGGNTLSTDNRLSGAFAFIPLAGNYYSVTLYNEGMFIVEGCNQFDYNLSELRIRLSDWRKQSLNMRGDWTMLLRIL